MSGPRAEFWKLRGLRGNKKNEKHTRRSRDDLLQLTIQGKFPAYERVLLREGGFLKLLISAKKNSPSVILNRARPQLISNVPSSSWVLSMTSPWRNWPERCPMSMRWQVRFLLNLDGVKLLPQPFRLTRAVFECRDGSSQWSGQQLHGHQTGHREENRREGEQTSERPSLLSSPASCSTSSDTAVSQDKHPLLDITPTAVERLNYIQYHPMVLFLDPHSRKDVKAMRQRYSPNSSKSSRRLYSQALKLRKHCSHLFSGRQNSINWTSL